MPSARDYHCIPVAIAFESAEKALHERNRDRPERTFVPMSCVNNLSNCADLCAILNGKVFAECMCAFGRGGCAAEIVREPLWNNLKHERGPFDIIGDVHGCFDELIDLLTLLGYTVQKHPTVKDLLTIGDGPPEGRQGVF